MIQTDAVVIGAGPVGLFQLFQLGLLGVQAHVADVLPEPGGQCVALYPDKPIYDIPGVPVCTGRSLTEQLLIQARPFLGTQVGDGFEHLHLGHQVSVLEVDDTVALGGYRFVLRTDQGLTLRARAIVVAAGAGAFVPRDLPIPGLTLKPENLHHQCPQNGVMPWQGQHLVVAGGGDEALQTVLDVLAMPAGQRPAQLTLLHRRDQFQADPALELAVRDAIHHGSVDLALGVPQGATTDGPRLTGLQLATAQGERLLTLDHLCVRLGLSPKLGPVADWGLALTRKQVPVDTSTFASAVPGIFAVGDINTYPGKKRLLLCGFHEATLAAHAVSALLNPDAPQHLLYTTTSPLLHQRLGL